MEQAVMDFEARENELAAQGIFADIFREERGHPAVAAEEHLAGASSLVTAPREVVAPQAVGDVVVLEPLALRIDPDDTFLLLIHSLPSASSNTHEIVARQTVRDRVAGDGVHSDD